MNVSRALGRATGLLKVLPFICLCPALFAQAPSNRVVLTLDKPVFYLGENVLVHYCFENISTPTLTIFVGGDYSFASRSLRFRTTVTDAQGTVVADPDPDGYSTGGLAAWQQIAPGERWCQSLPLLRYARVESAGEYTVRVVHDLGLPAGQAPEGLATVRFVMPTLEEAKEVFAATSALPQKPVWTMGRIAEPYADFSTLRYPVYLPILLRRTEEGDSEVITGIGSIPTTEATETLVKLAANPNAAVASAALRALMMRVPDPLLDGTLGPRNPFENTLKSARRYLVGASWRPEFAPDVREIAKKLVGTNERESIEQGAFLLEAVGTSKDVPDLSAALTRAIEQTVNLPFETSVYPRPRGSVRELMRAAESLVARGYTAAAPGDSPGDLALWLVSVGKGARTADWQSQLGSALGHPIPYIRELALTSMPVDIPETYLPAVRENINSTEPDVQIAGCLLAARAKSTPLYAAVRDVFEKTTEQWVLNSCGQAIYILGGPYEYYQMLASRLAEPDMTALIFRDLGSILESNGRAGCCNVTAEQAKELSTRWGNFLVLHQTDVEAGRRISLEDPDVTPDLVPPGVTFTRTGKPDWPARQ